MAHPLLPKLWGEDNGRDVFSNLHREIDRVFDDFTKGGNWPFPATAKNGDDMMAPRIDVSETDDAIEVTAELPGVDEKEIDVSLTEDILTIKAEKKSEREKDDKDYRLMERSYGLYERSMRLPCEVKSDKIEAAFKNGVLKLTLPKSAETKAKTQKIVVQAH